MAVQKMWRCSSPVWTWPEATDQRLAVVDFNKPFHVWVDASNYTVAGYLSQYDENTECPLAFFSLKLNGTQKTWAAVHKEAYAVIAALKKFRNWVFSVEIHVHSDHNPLSFLTESAPKNAKLMHYKSSTFNSTMSEGRIILLLILWLGLTQKSKL